MRDGGPGRGRWRKVTTIALELQAEDTVVSQYLNEDASQKFQELWRRPK